MPYRKLFAVISLVAISASVQAIPVVYTGSDNGASATDPRPNSDASAASFDAAAAGLGTINTINFEGMATGYSASMALDSNVTANYGGSIDPTYSGITNTSSTNLGYNTTAGGSNFLQFSPTFNWTNASLTMTFNDAVSSFGAYFTGLESGINGTVDVLFDDGSANSYTLPENLNGGVSFWGFTDAGKSISSLTFNEVNGDGSTRDIWGIDDIRYVKSSVPEPSALLLLGAGLVGMGLTRRRKDA